MPRPELKMDKEQAFELYYNKPGDRITLAQVAAHFDVRADYVRKIAADKKWKDRALDRDKAVRRETEARQVKSHAERVIDNLKIIDALKAKFAKQLMPKSAYEIEGMNVREYFEMVKLEMLLTGNPTSISVSEAKARQLTEIEAEIQELDDRELLEELRINGMLPEDIIEEENVSPANVGPESDGVAEAPEASA